MVTFGLSHLYRLACALLHKMFAEVLPCCLLHVILGFERARGDTGVLLSFLLGGILEELGRQPDSSG